MSSSGDEPKYFVEKILKKRVNASGVAQYLVKWRGKKTDNKRVSLSINVRQLTGYSDKDNTWEPYSNLKPCKEIVQQFEKDRKKKG